jgi:hypothetical protein
VEVIARRNRFPAVVGMRARGALALAVGAGAVLLGLVVAPSAAGAATSTAGNLPPGTSAVTQTGPGGPVQGVLKYLDSRQGVVQVAVFNASTGTTSIVSNGSAPQATASIAKVDILAMWLHNYDAQGVAVPGAVPFSITYLMQQMIQDSVNPAATSLFYFGGGCDALTAFNTLVPTQGTTVGCQTPIYYGWGDTTTSAADQAALVKLYAYPNNLLGADARQYGLGLMENISPGQGWGISCGPWGTSCNAPDYAQPVPGVTVALKNGWKYSPSCVAQNQICPWQMNSIGWVHGDGRNYVIAVLTGYDPAGPGLYGYNYGINTVQGVSKLVWSNLAPSS